jgi:hypothetical protein
VAEAELLVLGADRQRSGGLQPTPEGGQVGGSSGGRLGARRVS